MKTFSQLKKYSAIAATIMLLLTTIIASKKPDDRGKILVFTKTKGWHHTSIPFGIAAVNKLGLENGYSVDTTTNAAIFTDENLKQYRAVVFLSTTGNVLNGEEQAAFERYIQAGGGFVGVHAAADTEYDWPWYGKLVGAWFESHPNGPNVRRATIDVVDKDHPASKDLPTRWTRTDEWYNYKSIYSELKILAYLDESSYDGGVNGNHPITWYHEFDGGRAFYTGLGHTDESYSEPLFLKHLAGGIKYAMGDGKPLDYSKAYSKVTPDPSRFVKTILATNLGSPMALAVADDGRIFFTQMLGELTLFNARTNKSKLLHKFTVTNIGGTGLIGIALDPHFLVNHYLYLYYAPGGQDVEPLNFHLSRFTIKSGDVFDPASEKILLKVPVQKNSGSHHGGSLAWDKSGNLYLSTGDGSSPFPSNGYAPQDERPGQEFYSLDAQRSAANTNDFKGKVLRIHPEANGTYTIPAGNLFPKGMAKTRPEIYVMGCRNPYRISVNPRTSTLYWGEVGPDAGRDGKPGPRGYDEFNQAKKAGNFGWPYFVGNNKAYVHWDFATNTAGPLFDAKAPVNNSPNNTGLNQLPPAQSAMIWYPYAFSDEFAELGLGGRCAIGGPVYIYNPKAPAGKFPDYYDNKLFIADWMRNWLMAVQFDANENYERVEPFMATNGDFKRPIDIKFGADGMMYMLEYGSVYGLANKDASLVKIIYNDGNRPPIAKATIVDSVQIADYNKRAYLTSDGKNPPIIKIITGQAPLKVKFSSNGSKDLDDNDQVTYQWLFDGKVVGAKTPLAMYTYTKPGIYKAILKVTDKAGLSSRDTLTIKVGNTAPIVTIGGDNRSFYWKDKPYNYNITVKDAEDKKIDPKQVKAFYTYNAGSEANYPGKTLMTNSDCKSCHQVDKMAVGPSFIAVANRYKTEPGSSDKLAQKIITGGGGSWSKDHVMSAHPQFAMADAKEIVKYIFSLTDKKVKIGVIPIPLKGSLNLKYSEAEPHGVYTIVITYTDKGGKIVGPLKSTDKASLRYAEMNSAFTDAYVGFSRNRDKLSEGGNKAYLKMVNVDLTGITGINLNYGAKDKVGDIEVRLDSRSGPIISKITYNRTGSFDKNENITASLITPINGKHDIFIFAVKYTKPNDGLINIHTVSFVH
jgi:cytochrome c